MLIKRLSVTTHCGIYVYKKALSQHSVTLNIILKKWSQSQNTVTKYILDESLCLSETTHQKIVQGRAFFVNKQWKRNFLKVYQAQHTVTRNIF
jgi:hypothetical protein